MHATFHGTRAAAGIGLLATILHSGAAVAAESFEECGLVLTPAEAGAYLESIAAGPPPPLGGIPGPPYYVAIAPHIIRRSDGSGGLPVAQYEQAMVDANLAYANTGIVFYTLGEIDYIDSDAFYLHIDSISEIDAMRTTNPVPDAINIYFTPNLRSSPNTLLCGISAFTFSSVQAIAMSNSCTATATNHSTYAHEIGHYFDLFHTHETAFDDELVDGSNCEEAGDLLCDTPADPGLGTSTVDEQTCAYTGSETDANGDLYDPDTLQFLSYSLKHCRDRFSPQSEAKIVQTLLGPRANLISPVVGVRAGLGALAAAFVELSPPRPNPTPRGADVSLAMPEGGFADVAVVDVRGARVRTLARGTLPAGTHAIVWDGRDGEGRAAAPGIYFVRASAEGGVAVRKVEVVR